MLKRINPAMVVALVALFVALSGSSLAAYTALAPANSVGTRQLINGSIRLTDLNPSAVRLLKGQKGDQGPRGEDGEFGPAGPAGGFNVNTLAYHFSASSTIAPGQLGAATATCPAGSKVTGGGFSSASGQTLFSAAVDNGTAWRILVGNPSGTVTIPVMAFAVCASP